MKIDRINFMIRIPQGFQKKFKKLLGDEYSLLLDALERRSRDAIRANTLKISKEELKERLLEKGWKLQDVPWFSDAFFVETVETIAKTKEYFLGYYYMQDAGSLVPPIVLDPKPGEQILDLCAAPGSKTTQIAQMMKNKGLIIANDVNSKKVKILSSNLQKAGVTIGLVTKMKGQNFWKLGMVFDKILLDVPCSSSGTFITNHRILNSWSKHIVNRLASLQRRLLASAYKVLKPGGILVYSTCSMDPEENEENISWITKKFGFEIESIEIQGLKYRKGLQEWNGKKYLETEKCIRFYPWDNWTEGFFICKLRKQM